MGKAAPNGLEGLHDVVTPPAVSYAPQTVGWVVLVAALVVFLGWLGWRAWKKVRANRYRKVALAEIDRIEAALREPMRRSAPLAGVNEILKRTALTAWPRPDVASLAGESWLAFLDETAGGERFRRGPGKALADRAYAPNWTHGDQNDTAALLGVVRHWIRHHRSPTSVRRGRPARGPSQERPGARKGRL